MIVLDKPHTYPNIIQNMPATRLEYDQTTIFTKELIKTVTDDQINTNPADFSKFEGMAVSQLVEIQNTPSDVQYFDACMLLACHYIKIRKNHEKKRLEKLGIFVYPL